MGALHDDKDRKDDIFAASRQHPPILTSSFDVIPPDFHTESLMNKRGDVVSTTAAVSGNSGYYADMQHHMMSLEQQLDPTIKYA